MKLAFHKYQGTGNDFIILDGYTQPAPVLTGEQISRLCHRQKGIGADGLMILERKEGFDFGMVYYNSDGLQSTLCGNGARCLVKYAHQLGIHKDVYRFAAIDGEHTAEIETNGTVVVSMPDVNQVEYHSGYALLNTGSPHFIKFAREVEDIDVVATGREIRYSKPFEAEGINVNFVENITEDRVFVRTYERGVENETLSCGTGVTAAALMSAHNENGFNTVDVKTPGGNLRVEFDRIDEQHFRNIRLCGPAVMVFKGEIEI
jgi:diaminopimelate epimerase